MRNKPWYSPISFLAFVLNVTFAFSANADVNTDVARCATESNSIKRLECFDSLSNRLGVAFPKTTVTTASKWRVRKEISRIDDSTNVIISLDADSSITGWPSKTYTPRLILRCKEHDTEAFIVTGMPPQVEYETDVTTITLRFDKEKATEFRTSKSTDGEALFFRQSVGIIRKMLRHTTMLFVFVPFNSSPVMTTFDLHGLEEAAQPLREICEW